MPNIIRKQAFNLLKKSLDNFNFNQKSENCANEAQTKKIFIGINEYPLDSIDDILKLS
jgi:hypothetical protein